MKTWYLFLLIYFLGSCCDAWTPNEYATCKPHEDVNQGSSRDFLQCVGLPSSDSGTGHMQDLKNILEATMDLYTFMRSRLKGVPVLSIKGALEWTPDREFENEELVEMWLEIKIKPLLKSISKQFLSCLSTKNFTCSSYQTVVKKLSHYYSEMDPARQKWIYMFFMYPFLSGENVKGCVMRNQSSEDWLMMNFGYFKAMARFSDFTKINVEFRGLEVLHLLTSTQTAELVLLSDPEGLSNHTRAAILHNLSSGRNDSLLKWPHPEGPENNFTSVTKPPYKPPSPEDQVRWVFNDITSALKPVGNVVHKFVSLTHKKKESEMTSAGLIQFALDCALAEMANRYQPQVQEKNQFDVLDLEDWYEQVVMPLLRRFLPHHMLPLNENVRLAFEEVFYLDGRMDDPDPETEDVCSITLDKRPCVLTDTVKNVAQVLHCAARADLTLDEPTVLVLINEMLKRMNSLLKQLATSDSLIKEIQEIFTEDDSQPMTEEHLNDPEFIRLWFKVKMMPLLPNVSADLLSCLSSKNFTCPVYQAIVRELSHQMEYLDVDPENGHRIYNHFIYAFLHNANMPRCLSNDSAEWLKRNFAFFLRFADITDFVELNPYFDPLSVLPHLTAKHLVHLLLLNLSIPVEKRVAEVFDFLVEVPQTFTDVLELLPKEAEEVRPPCSVYKAIFTQLERALQELPQDESFIRQTVEELTSVTPEECITEDIACPITRFNEARTCRHVDSSEVEKHLNSSVGVSCNYTLEEYACAQLQNFSADHLLSLMMCDLPGQTGKSKMLWKMLLTKVISVWSPALDKLAMMPMHRPIPAAKEILDLFREMKLSSLSEDELKNSSVIAGLFSGGIRSLLPFASEGFFSCLSRRNLSCETFQHIVWVLSSVHIDHPRMAAEKFIVSFLSRQEEDPGCSLGLNSTLWLKKNLGSFSEYLTLEKMLQLNPSFEPLEVLPHLTPWQLSLLFLLNHRSIPDKEFLIGTVFDLFNKSSDEDGFERFLSDFTLIVGKANLTCSDNKILFSRLDESMDKVSPRLVEKIQRHKLTISQHLPAGCVIYGGTCHMTPVNETEICEDVDSSGIQEHLESLTLTGHHCLFSVKEVACAELSMLEPVDLAEIMKCHRSANSSGSRAAWKLLLSKANGILNESLDHVKDLDPDNPAVPAILDVIQELRIDFFSLAFLDQHDFYREWVRGKLHPFLPAASRNFLMCMAMTDFDCTTYQDIVSTMNHLPTNMSYSTQKAVYTNFIKPFLTRSDLADPSCSSNSNNTADWINLNMGSFSVFASFLDLEMFRGNFSGLDVLELLTTEQLGQMCATPNQIKSEEDVAMVMEFLTDEELQDFFESFHSVMMEEETEVPLAVRPFWLSAMFDRAKLTHDSVSDDTINDWIMIMGPFIADMSPEHTSMFFKMVSGRSCGVEKEGSKALHTEASTFSQTTSKQIHEEMTKLIKGQNSVRCMKQGESFYVFLMGYFGSFGFPSLTQTMSFIPTGKKYQMINSMPPSDLGEFLRRPGVVDSHSELCDLFKTYQETPDFIHEETLNKDLYGPTMTCVWPMVLGAADKREADLWKRGLGPRYMKHLNRNMIGANSTHSASCFGFQIFVACLGTTDFNEKDFQPKHVYESIMDYLPSSSVPKCYNSSHPELNSTAWFARNLGEFFHFVSADDFLKLGSEQDLGKFTVNSENLALLNATNVTAELNELYTDFIFIHDPNFPVDKLPFASRCFAPGRVFSNMNKLKSEKMLEILQSHCADMDPEITAAIAGNFGSDITANTISILGNQCSGLTTGVLRGIRPEEVYKGRLRLGSVEDWNIGQVKAIMKVLMGSGLFQINGDSFVNIGSLVRGITGEMFSKFQGSDLLTASAHSSFVSNLNASPRMAKFIAIYQLVLLNSNSEQVITNVPDELAEEIPASYLLSFPDNVDVKKKMNKKKWKRSQAEFIFPNIATETSILAIGNESDLSSAVLQGFTCTSTKTFKRSQTKKLIKACRRKKKNKVKLVESQLTCMYNYIKGEADVTSYGEFPEDMLLYYNYSLVPPATCRDYFLAINDADFSVYSPTLGYMRSTLMTNGMDCLSISGNNLTKENVQVLGTMCCYVDSSFIQNSDPYLLEVLKACGDLSSAQAEAAEAMLLSGKTSYGDPSEWEVKTLKNLGMFPLYMSSRFYASIKRRPKKRFMKYFSKYLRRSGVSKKKIKAFKKNCRKGRSKRAVDSDCVIGEITYTTITAEDFPNDDMDVSQFRACLSAAMVSQSLAEITEKVVEDEYLLVVLEKLDEVYPTMVPEDQVALLGLASRMANTTHVTKWNITQVDTLAALLDSDDGAVEPEMAKAIITKYLAADGNTLTTDALNAITGPNLCALSPAVLKNITQDALRDSDLDDFSSCTQEKKTILFQIALGAFGTETRSTVSASTYQLTRSYLGGATTDYINTLAASGIDMDVRTFSGLDPSVLKELTVDNVRGLLGTHVSDLELYENDPGVQTWITNRFQTDLDTLGLGLTGGKANPPTVKPATTKKNTNKPATNKPATNKPATNKPATNKPATTKPSSGNHIQADMQSLFFLLLLTLLITRPIP